MNNLFEEKRTLFLLLLILFFSLLLALYFFWLQPLSGELRNMKSANTSLEADVALLEAKNKNESVPTDAEALRLEKKVPLNPELEKLLLSFQEIEQVSGSRIEQADFEYDGSEPEFDIKEDEETAEGQDGEQAADGTANEDIDSETEHGTVAAEDPAKPENLHLVTASLTVLAPDHKHFMQFLTELEKLERVTRVDELELIQPTEQELEFSDAPSEVVSFKIKVTTFYHEK